MKAIRAIATGKVQGVCYRESTRAEANRIGVSGWVRNLPDGSVEAVLQGDLQDIEQLVNWMEMGPQFAIVEKPEVEDIEIAELFSRFSVQY